jgi:chorismate lyase/3-hydroxybenzoate synthase
MAIRFVSPANAAELAGAGAGCVLGGCLICEQSPVMNPGWPVQQVRAPVLGHDRERSHQEVWLSDDPCTEGQTEGIRWRRAGDVLFGLIERAESEVEPAAGQTALQAISEQAYASIFRLLDAQALPHLWRVWNYLADITGESAGMERYRQFNLGRALAFEQGARSVEGRVPAACAIGVAAGPLSIAFLAGATPLVSIENPRQVSAFHYPTEYGPRAPIFSRAALAHPPGQELLFVSGTASIVGHRSLHDGQVLAQTREAMDNVAAVVAEATSHSHHGGFSLNALSYRVYVRHATDLPAVQSVMADRVGAAPVVYVQADICRRELLVEVEAWGSWPR